MNCTQVIATYEDLSINSV